MAISGAYFDVALIGTGAALTGGFQSVSGLGMEVEYEVYTEGGSNYPRFFFKNTKPGILVLEQGVVTSVDSVCPSPWPGPSSSRTALGCPSGSGRWWGPICRNMRGPHSTATRPAWPSAGLS